MALQEERRQRLYEKMAALYTDSKFRDTMDMSEEVLVVAGEVQSAQPEVVVAGLLYGFLGCSFTGCREYVKSMGVLEQAKALAKALAEETGNRSLLARVLQAIGVCHWRQGEHSARPLQAIRVCHCRQVALPPVPPVTDPNRLKSRMQRTRRRGQSVRSRAIVWVSQSPPTPCAWV